MLIRKNLISCFVLLVIGLFGTSAYAVPAAPVVHTLGQPDGSTFEARQWGDEWLHGWETVEGYSIVFDKDLNSWTYASHDSEGALVSSSKVVGKIPPPEGSKSIRPKGQALLRSQVKGLSSGIASEAGPQGVVPPTGTGKIPVILINFSNTTTTNTPAEFNTLLFGTSTNSMKDYYQQVSYNAFSVSGGSAGVMGWYTASNTHDYYGSDSGGKGNDAWPGDLVYEAIHAADLSGTVNFNDYDTNGDCYVDVVAIVHQGTGQEASGVAADIWSHSWDLYSAQYYGRSHYGPYTTANVCTANPSQHVIINNYIIQPERLCLSSPCSSTTQTTIGVFCHEYGHALGLPDLYDTDYSSEGVGNWSIMAGGSWNYVSFQGDRPALMDAWSKYKLGWVMPTQVNGTLTNESIQQAATTADVYKLLTGTEYFLVENRQKTGFDAGLPGAGLLIWHIDESKTNNTQECPGNPPCSNHYKLALVQADGFWNLEYAPPIGNRGDTGDPFPGSTSYTSFTACTSPNSNLYSGAASGVSITSISASAPTMTATLSTGGLLSCPGVYTMNPSATYSYIADANNQITSWVGGADEGYYDLSLAGFDFQFYKTPVTSVRITTNGYITFGTTPTSYANTPTPNASQPNAIIAPFWTDLDLTYSGSVRWRFYGVAPNRYLVIEWYQVPSYEYEAETYTFEIILYESTDRIKFQYLNVSSGTSYDSGALATVGIENFDGRAGLRFSYNTASLSNNKAIEFIVKTKPSGIADCDGDGKTDIAIYRKSTGAWFIYPSKTGAAGIYGVGFGGDASDVPVPGDYDGDGKTDIAIYRKSTGAWFIYPSLTGTPGIYGVGFGGDGSDIPVPGDYDGDGKTDLAIYRKTAGAWFIYPSSTGPSGIYAVGFGGDASDLPVPSDYDGDGKTDLAVYRKSTGAWFIKPSGGGSIYGVSFGGDASDIPVPADYDGDGRTDIAIYRKSIGAWFIYPSSAGAAGIYGVGFGGDASDIPVPGYYDGDAKADPAIYRKSTGAWFIYPSGGGSTYGVGFGGDVSDLPVTANLASNY